MIACLMIPGFELRAALRDKPRLALAPAALAPVPGTEPLVGPVTAAGELAGVQPGMRLGEALAMCPQLVLVEQDPAAVEREWEGVLRRLEDSGFAVEPEEPGRVYFETKGVERLYGGLEAALARALASVGTAWDSRAGAAQRRFAALAAASVARPGQALVVSAGKEQGFLAPLPMSLLPLPADRYASLEGLGGAQLGGAGGAAWGSGCGAARPGGTAGVGARARRGKRPCPRQAAACRAGGGARVPGGGRKRVDAPACVRLPARPAAGTAGAGGTALPQGRSLRPSRRRRLLAPHGDAARPDRRPAAPALGARPEAARDPGSVLEVRLEAVELSESVGRRLEPLNPWAMR